MNNGIASYGKYIHINPGYVSNPYINMSNMSAGMVRYNGNSSKFEVYDGSAWLSIIDSIPQIGLNNLAEEAIDWARKRIEEEREWENSDHPAIQAAVENLRKARQQVKITAILAEQEENNDKTTS